MAEQYVKNTKYKNELNQRMIISGRSNQTGPRQDNEPTGEGASLAEVGLKHSFGDRVEKTQPVALKEKAKKKLEQEISKSKKEVFKRNVDSSTKNTPQHFSDDQKDVLHVQIEEDLAYRPLSKETHAFYEQILHLVQRHMGDCSLETLKGAADEVIAILKQEGVQDGQRKKEIEYLIDRLSDTDFNSLVVFAQQLTDYAPQNEDTQKQNGEAGTQEEGQQVAEVAEMQVDPDMDFSGSESSDFDQVFNAKDNGEAENPNRKELKEQMNGDRQTKEIAGLTDVQEEVKIISSASNDMDNNLNQEEMARKDSLQNPQVTAHWLQNQLTKFLVEKEPEEIIQQEKRVLDLLGNQKFTLRECERKLISLLSPKNVQLVSALLKNRKLIYYGSALAKAQTIEEKEAIKQAITQMSEGKSLLAQLNLSQETQQNNGQQLKRSQLAQDNQGLKMEKSAQVTDEMMQKFKTQAQGANTDQKSSIDLESLKFEEGGRLMTNKKCNLPKGSTKIAKKGYDEIYVPAIRSEKKDVKQVKISELPEWTHPTFPENTRTLNTIQSALYNTAFKSPENVLVCAPTGAGKTNIAMMSILQVIGSKRRPNGSFDLRSFKIVYIAPMKALVSEVVGNFQKRLDCLGIKVSELTGDSHLTRQQMEETQIIVTTPEKWDIVTRKAGQRTYLDLVKLIIIDEVHLLHDTRGPVLEAIVSRTIRQIEQTGDLIRIVALSATLPNYRDVAAFLRVDPETGLFFFDQSYRPVPLEQIYIGITEKKAIKRLMLMNEICYEKVIERVGKHQVLIFSHSRKETARSAKIIRDMALAQDQLNLFMKEGSESKEILLSQVEKCDSQDLKDVLPYGLGMHHAGMTKSDRKMVEDLFAAGYLQVLCSTATLAWGVNLPAHTVILKGTQIYSPEKGKWVELSPQDVLQMMGRAGRPQYDTLGEGIILTNHSELQYYLSMNNMQLPIESQMISQLADQLCAEVVLGTISNEKEAVNWLAYTYLYVRMLRNPDLYGVIVDPSDPTLIRRRQELVQAAAQILSRSLMVKYDRLSGSLQSTPLGKIASHYYIKHESMQIYAENLKPYMTQIDIFRLFSLSKEFTNVPIRENEKLELQKFVEKVPVPVKGTLDEPATKINILLQAYISRFKMEGFDLNADMVYVTQSAGRIMRALFEICLKRNWAQLSHLMLNMCKMIEKRLWGSMTPLRQFTHMMHLEQITRKIEKKAQFQWHHFYDMTAHQIGEVVNFPKMGKTILSQIHKFPRLELEAYVQPITRTLVRIELDMRCHESFTWDVRYHGNAEPFWILVEDCDSEQILHSEQFILRQSTMGREHRASFTVPLYSPMPPQYFVKVISDRWLHAETSLPISFKHLLLPEKFQAPTPLQDLLPRPISSLQFPEVEQLYAKKDQLTKFNAIQTQVIEKVYNSDESVFLGAPSGSGLLLCAELAIFRELQAEEGGKILYLAPRTTLIDSVYQNWTERLSKELGLLIYVVDEKRTFQQQQKEIAEADLLMSCPQAWDQIQRRWRQRKIVQQTTLVILDQTHLMDAKYEVVASRARLMQSELSSVTLPGKSAPRPLRIVALSAPVANARDLALWLGVEDQCIFNFAPSVRPQPIEKSLQSFDQFSRQGRLQAMTKPAFIHIKKQVELSERDENGSHQVQALVVVSDRKQARITALEFVDQIQNEQEGSLMQADLKKIKANYQEEIDQLSELSLKRCLQFGVAILHEGLSKRETKVVDKLYRNQTTKILVVTQPLTHSLIDLKSNLVIAMDVEKTIDMTDGEVAQYEVADVLQIEGLANRVTQGLNGDSIAPKFVLMCYAPRRDFFVKFLQEPIPVESKLIDKLHDMLNTEIVVGTIQSKQEVVDWLTWTFMYRRLAPNPNYYNLSGRTPQHINDFLSQTVEDTVEDLVAASCIKVDEETDEIESVNFGKIAAFYGVSYQTMGTFVQQIQGQTAAGTSRKMRNIIQTLCQASEFSEMAARDSDQALLRQLAQYCTYSVSDQRTKDGDLGYGQDLNASHLKANILLQSHFNRRPLSVDLRLDQRVLLEKSLLLVHALIDVVSTHGDLNTTLLAMELSQMIVQAMWPQQSPLLQLPRFDTDLVLAFKEQAQVEDIGDFMNMDDDLRSKLLPIAESEMEKLANICNRYPLVELSWKIIHSATDEEQNDEDTAKQVVYSKGQQVDLEVTVAREEDPEDEEALQVFDEPVFAQNFPSKKYEDWWLVVGDSKSAKLLAIRKISNFRGKHSVQVKLGINLPEDSNVDLKLYLVCDSYIGCDIQEELKLIIK